MGHRHPPITPHTLPPNVIARSAATRQSHAGTLKNRTCQCRAGTCPRRCRNPQLRTNSPSMSLRGAQRRGCAAVREERALRMRRTPCAAVRDEGALRMRRAPCGYCGCNLTQESPTAYKPVHPYPLPLTRTARRVVVPYECETHPHRLTQGLTQGTVLCRV